MVMNKVNRTLHPWSCRIQWQNMESPDLNLPEYMLCYCQCRSLCLVPTLFISVVFAVRHSIHDRNSWPDSDTVHDCTFHEN